MTSKQTIKKEGRRHNITYTQAGVSCFVGQASSKFKVQFFVGKFSGKNPCLRIAENRWATCKKPTAHSGTFGFADAQSQRKKPKEPEFLPTLDRKLIN